MKRKIIAILLLVLSIGYIVMPYDFDRVGVVGFVDDFCLFMAAFVFVNASFQNPERKYIRRQLHAIAALFLLLAILAAFIVSIVFK